MDLDQEFDTKMLEIYEAGLKLKPPYKATRFILMVKERGGKDAADQLLATGDPSSGFTALYELGKENMKLCLEYLVLQHPWRTLFTEDQLAVARKRLDDYECPRPPEDSAM